MQLRFPGGNSLLHILCGLNYQWKTQLISEMTSKKRYQKPLLCDASMCSGHKPCTRYKCMSWYHDSRSKKVSDASHSYISSSLLHKSSSLISLCVYCTLNILNSLDAFFWSTKASATSLQSPSPRTICVGFISKSNC